MAASSAAPISPIRKTAALNTVTSMPSVTPIGAPSLDSAVRARIATLARENPREIDDGTLYERIIAEVERPLIEAMLARHGHNQLRAARAMGLNRNTLRKRLDLFAIDPAAGRRDAD